MSTGKVWLVGAGPGDAGLLTIKGRQGAGPRRKWWYTTAWWETGCCAMVPETARRIDVGKRAGNHTMPQEQINQVLLEEARKGLRGGAASRAGIPSCSEEAGRSWSSLPREGIPYEVVPGVTSCIAVPAYNGIPVTHRDYCSSVHVITGHKKAGKKYDINLKP